MTSSTCILRWKLIYILILLVLVLIILTRVPKVGDAPNQSRCLKKLCQVSRWISPGVWKALCWFVLDWLMSVRKWVNPGVSASPPVVSHFGPESTSPFVSKAKCWFTSGRKNQFRCLYKPCVDSFRAGLKKTSVARFRVGPEENQSRRVSVMRIHEHG